MGHLCLTKYALPAQNHWRKLSPYSTSIFLRTEFKALHMQGHDHLKMDRFSEYRPIDNFEISLPRWRGSLKLMSAIVAQFFGPTVSNTEDWSIELVTSIRSLRIKLNPNLTSHLMVLFGHVSVNTRSRRALIPWSWDCILEIYTILSEAGENVLTLLPKRRKKVPQVQTTHTVCTLFELVACSPLILYPTYQYQWKEEWIAVLTCSSWASGEAAVHCSCDTISPCKALGRLRRISKLDTLDFVELSVDPDPLVEIFMRLFKATIIVLEYIFPITAVEVWKYGAWSPGNTNRMRLMIATAAAEFLWKSSDYSFITDKRERSYQSMSLCQWSNAWVSGLSVELASKPFSVWKARALKLKKYKITYIKAKHTE